MDIKSLFIHVEQYMYVYCLYYILLRQDNEKNVKRY